MDTTVLDTEKFNSAKELADIQSQIATGRALLNTLKQETDEYTVEREKQVLDKIAAVLVESQTSLSEISKNQDALSRYAAQLRQAEEDIQAILLLFKAVRTKQAEVAGLDEARLEKKAEELVEVEKKLKAQRSMIEADMEAIKQERDWVAKERIKLLDERSTLDRAIARLKKGKI